jgi:pimeloyl-ACP methyl ester carboxylesterase
VHGWVGNQDAWMQNDINFPYQGNWKNYLESLGWDCGDTLHYCLDYLSEDLSDEANSDVHYFGNSDLRIADFYFINFDVKRNSSPYPDVYYYYDSIGYNDDTIRLNDNNLGNKYDIIVGDILARIDASDEYEYMKVTALNYDTEEFEVTRGLFGSTRHTWPENDNYNVVIKDHSNLSNQASLKKQGVALADAIQKVCQANSTDKVILICHSMGGLAARQYVQNNNDHHVAKIITVSTPHLGSNSSDISSWLIEQWKGLDLNSDAVRDLRATMTKVYFGNDLPDPPYGDYPDNAITLFGGTENRPWEDFIWYSYDFDGDGSENESDTILGLNIDSAWPSDLSMSCILAAIDGFWTDGVVLTDRQYPWPNLFPIYSVDTFLIQGPPLPFPLHTHIPKYINKIMKGFDQTGGPSFAYKLIPNVYNYTNEFSTYQNSMDPEDFDWFYFLADLNGTASVELYESPDTNDWELKIYNQSGTYLGYSINQSSGQNTLNFPITNN